MSTPRQFIRLAALGYVDPLVSQEWSRRKARDGLFGPQYLPKAGRRGLLLRLDLVLAALGLTEGDLAPALAKYTASHKQDRPPILNLKPDQVVEVAP